MEGITFVAILNKATVDRDGEWKVTLEVPKSEATAMLQLAQLDGEILQIGIVQNMAPPCEVEL